MTDNPPVNASGQVPLILTHAHERYGVYSAQMSTVVRSLAITATAVTWLFAGGLTSDTAAAAVISNIRGDWALSASMVLSLTALFADALHYAWASAVWGTYSWVLNEVWLSRAVVPDERRLGAKFAWTIAPMFRIVSYVHHYGLTGQDNINRVPSRVAASTLLSAVDTNPELSAALALPWSPKWLNRGSLLLFWLKFMLTGGAYISLLAIFMRLFTREGG